MPDEEFLNMNGPAEPETAEPEKEEEPSEEPSVPEEEQEGDPSEELSEEELGNEEDPDSQSEPKETDPQGSVDGETSEEDGSEEEPDPKKEESSGESTNYEELYKQIMTPFKANGKLVSLKDPSEVIQLMQMGANYTQKMQAIQPHRKVLLMLQNNDLLDEGKLSYLIDLDKKDPGAIQKLIKDSGVDPMDIDTESEPKYQAGDHRVSDEEASFRSAMEDIGASDAGKETLQVIQQTWDQPSKNILWAQPDILSVIQAQRESGIYDQIASEVDRQKMLGKMSSNTPFLEAYKLVGDELQKAGAFGGSGPSEEGNPQAQPARKVTEKAAKPAPKATNGDKAKAASTSRRSSRQSAPVVNPLAMSDEEFLKMDNLKNRV
jgi:hypothetical protein